MSLTRLVVWLGYDFGYGSVPIDIGHVGCLVRHGVWSSAASTSMGVDVVSDDAEGTVSLVVGSIAASPS